MITDLSMPEMDGITLIRAVQTRFPRMPAILLTGYAGDAATLAVGGVVEGSFTLLRKPITYAQLHDLIAALLETMHDKTLNIVSCQSSASR
jgi:DNA-binding NtrC family response regulator